VKKSPIAIAALALAFAAVPALASPEAKTAKKEASVSVSAVVDAIDYKTREVTLSTSTGKTTVVAGDDVKNLASVHKGDTVTVTYREGLLAEARTPTDAEKAQPYQESVTGGTGSPAKPGASIGYQIKAVTTVMAIDKTMHTITFKGPRGRVETIHAEDPKNLDKVKVGDTVVFTYTEAVALSIQPAPKM
jgi:FtsP/CotA-like multicopper oxidase with cupredoxin domain